MMDDEHAEATLDRLMAANRQTATSKRVLHAGDYTVGAVLRFSGLRSGRASRTQMEAIMGDITDEELHDVVEEVMIEEIQTLRVSVEDWKKVAQDWAKEHLATAKRLVEAEVALAQAKHLHAEAEADLARLSVRLVEADALRVWQAEGKAPSGSCPYCGSTVSVVQRDEWYVARCSHRGCGASGPQHRSLTRAVDWFCRHGKGAP